MISVIIPTYNRKNILPRTLKSVLNQTFQDFEIIVIDDASTDATKELFKTDFNSKKIRYEKLSVNQGVHSARNRGIETAKGDYLVFLDSDDELLPQALAKASEAMAENPLAGLVSAPFKTERGELTGFERKNDSFIDYPELLCEKHVRRLKTGFAMARKSLIGNTGFAMQNLDFIFYRRLAKKTKMYFIAEPLGIYHIDENKNSLHKSRKAPNIELSIKRGKALADFLNEFGNDIIKFCPENYGFYAYGAAVGMLLAGKKSEAIKLARDAAKHTPKIRYNLFYMLTILPLSPLILRFLFRVKRLLKY